MGSIEKVDVLVERQWHIGLHATTLANMGRLGHVYGGFPAFRYKALGIESRYLRTNPAPAVWNQVAGKLKLRRLAVDAPKILARWGAGKRDLNRYFNCYSTVYRYLFPLLAKREQILIIERGSTHPEEYFERLNRGFREARIPCAETISNDDRQEIEAGHLAHFLVVGSRMMYDSYVSRGYDSERMLLIPYAVNHARFRSQERTPHTGPVRIACVGSVGVRKGLLRLIKIARWAENAGIAIEIRMFGPLEPEAPALLADAGPNVHLLGVKKGNDLIRELHECDLYCLPSYAEGFPVSVLEAMSTGLPAIVSNDHGGREVITPGEDGLILSDFTGDELDHELRPVLEDRGRRIEMGRAARRKIESSYTLVHYKAKLAAEYQRMFDIVDRTFIRSFSDSAQ